MPYVKERASSFSLFLILLGIPVAGFVAIIFAIEFARLIYGQANPLLLAVEIASWLIVIGLVLALRSRLALAGARNCR